MRREKYRRTPGDRRRASPAASDCVNTNSGGMPDALAPPLAPVSPDPGLARVISAWSGLPLHIRSAVLALIQAAP